MTEGVMNVISGCSGIGGLDLGFKWQGFRTVCYIENEPFPQSVLLEKMQEGILDIAPIFDDFTTFDGTEWRGVVDCIIAGIPCQPHSKAGNKRRGEDERNLWHDYKRIITEVSPKYVVLENVTGLYETKDDYGYVIASELYSMGYVGFVGYISASSVGAIQTRYRTFTVCIKSSNALCIGQLDCKSEIKPVDGQQAQHEIKSSTESTNFDSNRIQRDIKEEIYREFGFSCFKGVNSIQELRNRPYIPEPLVCREVYGSSNGVHRIKALGNMVVPQVAEVIAKIIKKIEYGVKSE